MRRTIFLLTLSLFAAPVFADDVDKTIRSLVEPFEAAIRAGNADQVVAVFADDAVLMAPNLPQMKGRQAIRGFWTGLFASGKADLDITIEDISRSGDIAVERGTWKLELVPNGAPAAVHDNGKYVLVWQKRNGKWQAVTDIFNSDLPAMK